MEKERMVQASMDEMSKAFHRAHKALEATIKASKAIAKMMEDGALQGEAGDEFRAAIESKLVPKTTKLAAKLLEMEKDVREATQRIHEDEGKAKGRFQN